MTKLPVRKVGSAGASAERAKLRERGDILERSAPVFSSSVQPRCSALVFSPGVPPRPAEGLAPRAIIGENREPVACSRSGALALSGADDARCPPQVPADGLVRRFVYF